MKETTSEYHRSDIVWIADGGGLLHPFNEATGRFAGLPKEDPSWRPESEGEAWDPFGACKRDLDRIVASEGLTPRTGPKALDKPTEPVERLYEPKTGILDDGTRLHVYVDKNTARELCWTKGTRGSRYLGIRWRADQHQGYWEVDPECRAQALDQLRDTLPLERVEPMEPTCTEEDGLADLSDPVSRQRKAVEAMARIDPAQGVARTLLLSLSVWYDVQAGGCTCSRSTMARKLGVNDKTIRRSLQVLEASGLVSISRRAGRNTVRLNL